MSWVPILARSLRKVGNLKPQQPFVQEENRPPIVHLLDDGFQHRQLARNVDILLLDRHDWHDLLLPAAICASRSVRRRASIIAIPATDPKLEDDLRAWGWQGPVLRLRRTMKIPLSKAHSRLLRYRPPEQFFAGLEAAGLKLAFRQVFPIIIAIPLLTSTAS